MDEANINPLIINCTFKENIISDIKADIDGTLTFVDCTFENYSCDHLLRLQNINSKGTIEGTIYDNCTFQNHNNHKSAIIGEFEFHNHTFRRCIIQNNAVGNEEGYIGGGLHTYIINENYGQSIGYLNIDNCSFISNVGRNYGGGANIDSVCLVSIDETYFINNSVVVGEASTDFGGGLFIYQSSILIPIVNCYFIDNFANNCGGGLFFGLFESDYDYEEAYNIPVIVKRCTFINCSSNHYGGGIGSGRLQNKDTEDATGTGDLQIDECEFKDCQARFGGGISTFNGTREGDEETNITNCIFDHCSGYSGGCIRSCSYKFVLENCTFINNADDFKAKDLDSTGGDDMFPGFGPEDPLDVYPHSFLSLNMDETEISPTISKCIFKENNIDIIQAEIGGTLTFVDCTFENYSCDHLLRLQNINSKGTIEGTIYDNCTFQNHNNHKSAIIGEFEFHNHTFRRCIIQNNAVGNEEGYIGGGLHTYIINENYGQSIGYLNIDNCSFISNVGRNYGGGANIDSVCLVSIDETYFINNSVVVGEASTDFGGGLFIYQSSILIPIVNCYFIDNFANNCGGGLFFGLFESDYDYEEAYNIPVIVKRCTFINCS